MLNLVLKRLALAVPTILILIVCSFLLMHAAPGGPFTAERALTPEILANLEAKYNQMQTKYAAAMQKAQAGQLTQVEQKQVETELAKMQQDYAKSEQDLSASLMKKEQALLAPIEKKIKNTIDQIAKDKGYRYIFDSSKGGSILYGRDSDDVMKYVKPKLGIK